LADDFTRTYTSLFTDCSSNSSSSSSSSSAGSFVQNSVRLAMTGVAEVVVKASSRVFLALLATGKPDSYVTMAAVH